MDAESVATGDAHAEHTAADRSSTQQSEDPNSMVADMLRRTSLRTSTSRTTLPASFNAVACARENTDRVPGGAVRMARTTCCHRGGRAVAC